MTTAQRLMKWASEIHLARQRLLAIEHAQKGLVCQRPEQANPCWWYTITQDQVDGFGGVELRGYREYAGGGSADIDGAPDETGDPSAKWCAPCQRSHIMHREHVAAARRLGSLRGALWRLAAKAHAEVEAELDEAGK